MQNRRGDFLAKLCRDVYPLCTRQSQSVKGLWKRLGWRTYPIALFLFRRVCGMYALGRKAMPRGEQLCSELNRLAAEVDTVLQTLVIPGWGGPHHGLPDTLYGFLMGTFSRIDLYSAYWKGNFDRQSVRMVDFMVLYMNVGHAEATLALYFWRHKLMHTSAPRELYGATTGRGYRWLLHWSDEHLPREQHFQFQPNGQILNLSLVGLIDNTKQALNSYLASLAGDSLLEMNFDKVESELCSYKVPNL